MKHLNHALFVGTKGQSQLQTGGDVNGGGVGGDR